MTPTNQNVNRDYDPMVGKYVESDPIGQRCFSAGGGFVNVGANIGSYALVAGEQ